MINPKRAKSMLKKAVKNGGELVTFYWQEWPTGEPEKDPTTGAALGKSQAVEKSCPTKAMVHIVTPSTGGIRRFAEIELGDAILDLIFPLFRITDAGETDFEVGQVVDEIALNRANWDVVGNPAAGEEVTLKDLKVSRVVIQEETWVQKPVGAQLLQAWDAIHGGQTFLQTIALRKAT